MVKTAVGFDEVDLDGYGKRGIPVCNTPDYGTREVADHAIALMMTLVKSIAFHDEALREDPLGNWRPALNPYGRRLSACTFGVVGLGRIGTTAIRRAQAFDKDCVFYDPYQPNGVELALNLRRARSLEELMGQCDVVSIHTPLNDETRGLIGKRRVGGGEEGDHRHQHGAGADHRHRRLARCAQGRHGARRWPRRAAGRTGEHERTFGGGLASRRGVDQEPGDHHAALGVLHAGKRS